MAIPHTVDVARYLRSDQAAESRKLMEGYFADICRIYGIEQQYFRQDTKFPLELRDRYEGLIYEENIPTFDTSATFPMYITANQDAFVLTKFGVEAQNEYTAYFLIKDFNFAFASLNDQQSLTATIPFDIEVTGWQGLLSSELVSPDEFLSGLVSTMILPPTSGDVSGMAIARYYNFDNEVYINSSLAWKMPYDYVKSTFSSWHGPYVGNIDANGNGSVSGELSGVVIWKKLSDAATKYKQIKPLPKDFFRMQFSEGNPEQFEITDVIDRNLMPNGINPLLAKYIYACNIARREFSHESGLVGAEPSAATDLLQQEADMKEYISDTLFNYKSQWAGVDKPGADRVYGGYGAQISGVPENWTPTSAITDLGQLSAQTVTGLIFSFDFGSKLVSDGLHAYFVPVSSNTGFSFDTPGFEIDASLISNTTSMKYLDTTDNALIFTDVSGVSAVINSVTNINPYLIEQIEPEISKFYLLSSLEPVSSGTFMPINHCALWSDSVNLWYIDEYQNATMVY